MTLIRLVQKASIVAGITFAGFSCYSNLAHADEAQFCATASNGQTACGQLKTIERLCVITSTGSTTCGKFKSFKPSEQQAIAPIQGAGYRKEVGNVVYTLKGCRKSDTNVKCELGIMNKGTERQLQFFNASFVDFEGKSHKSSTVDIGGSSGSNIITATITPGIDYSASTTFENVPNQVVKSQLLNLRFGEKVVQFRNVAFSN
jgi:hypothetical protein